MLSRPKHPPKAAAVRAAAQIGVLVILASGFAQAGATHADYESRVDCEIVDASPAFEQDLTLFCATNEYLPDSVTPSGVVRVRKSIDGGASWLDLPSLGLQGLGVSYPTQLVVSPLYPENTTLYLQVSFGTNPGLYRSTDDGNTFINVDPLAGSGISVRSLTPFLDPTSSSTGPLTGADRLAYAAPEDEPALISPPLVHAPAVGAPDRIIKFLLPEGFPVTPGYGLATGAYRPSPQPDTWQVQTFLYRCEPSLACPSKLFEFPPGWDLLDGEVLANGAIYVVLSARENPDDLTVWLSEDLGETFERWTSVETYLANLPTDRITSPTVSVSVPLDARGTYFLRVSYQTGSTKKSPPTELILRSKDGGQHWKRRSFGRHFNHPSPGGTVPWNNRAGPRHAQDDLLALPNRRLLVIARETDRATGNDYTGIFCSTDGGRSWDRACQPSR